MSDEKSKLVYSTEKPVSRKETGNRVSPLTLSNKKAFAPCGVVVRLERKHRGGKAVTVVEGLPIPEKEKEQLLKQLKTGLGTGGTLRDGSLEIQGDRRDAIIGILTTMGYSPKRSGG